MLDRISERITVKAVLAATCVLLACSIAMADENQPQLLAVTKIWDEAPHNAFTGLTRFKDQWFCTFREATNHRSMDGRIRIITSKDGSAWESAELFELEGYDLRDPKIYATPDDNLLLLTRRRWPDTDDKAAGSMSMIWLSQDGRTWEGPHDIGEPDDWLWSMAWHDNVAYSVGYGKGSARLYRSDDGFQFEVINRESPRGNETRLLFEDDGTLICLARASRPMLGRSKPPYKEWDWTQLNFTGQPVVILGGPDMLRLPDGRIVVGCRIPDPDGQGGSFRRTGLFWLDLETNTLDRFMVLPSRMDTSYTGMVWHDGILWVSYYSSHEGKTSVYLAKVQIQLQ